MVAPRSWSLLHYTLGLAQEADDYSNSVALFRKPGMVIEYLDVPESQTGGVPFHGLTLCGEAAGSAPEDKAAEEFLRISEPPAHDKWESTDELASVYVPGGVKSIREFKELVRREVRKAITRSTSASEEARTASNVSSRSELLRRRGQAARPPAG